MFIPILHPVPSQLNTMNRSTRILIGASGYVGTTLQGQTQFDAFYRSADINDIRGQASDLVVCAAAPAQKWLANRDPLADRENIERLIGHLASISCATFVLISTVDVFSHPVDVDESTAVDETGLHAYGLHRRLLEKFVTSHFRKYLIVRLPGLVGPGLRKNIVYDFLHGNNLHAIDSRAVFQFYPMVNLWYDIQIALAAELELVHLTAAPIAVSQVAEQGFGKPFAQEQPAPVARYDFRSIHAARFGGEGAYQYSARESIQAIRAYAQSELRA